MKNIVKLGLKERHLRIPKGWKWVDDGNCQEGDAFANVGSPNAPFWQRVEEDDIGMPYDTFDCLIRKVSDVD